jgi:GNAT superfamily N-acetyltransferase
MTLVVVTLRPATAADAAAVAAVWHDAWHDGHRGRVPDALLPDRDPAYFAGRARELVEHTTTAWDGERLLGVAIVVEDELQQLMVAAAARGTGVGVALIEAAEAQVAAAGYDEIWLAVVPANEPARRFYARRGWVDRGAEEYPARTLLGAVVPVPVHRYAKRLREELRGS